MFAAIILAEAGRRPIVIERGQPVEERVRTVERFWREGILDEESNVQFGEGGAGTFSDGKLTTGIKDVRISKVLGEFVKAGASPEILYRHKKKDREPWRRNTLRYEDGSHRCGRMRGWKEIEGRGNGSPER